MNRKQILKTIHHEIQVAEGIHLSDVSKKHIDRLLWEYEETRFKKLHEQLQYWIGLFKKLQQSKKCKCSGVSKVGMFKAGDWIVNSITGSKGYILRESFYSKQKLWVRFITDKNNNSIIPFELEIPLDLLTPAAIELHYSPVIMDLALLTKDEAWFNELMKIKGEKVNG